MKGGLAINVTIKTKFFLNRLILNCIYSLIDTYDAD